MDHQDPAMARGRYGRLALMTVLSFIAMYVLMYAMVDRAENIHPSLNQAYMAGLMTAPMVVIELVLMGMMYPWRGVNLAILVVSVTLGLACFAAIRHQVLIDDEEFLRSMIPHHAGAILMCREASIDRPDLERLCGSIIAGQQAEIDQMETMLSAGSR